VFAPPITTLDPEGTQQLLSCTSSPSTPQLTPAAPELENSSGNNIRDITLHQLPTLGSPVASPSKIQTVRDEINTLGGDITYLTSSPSYYKGANRLRRCERLEPHTHRLNSYMYKSHSIRKHQPSRQSHQTIISSKRRSHRHSSWPGDELPDFTNSGRSNRDIPASR
jgi:hypothetical protein